MNRITIVLILAMVLIACKNNTKESEGIESETQFQEFKKELVVKINFKTNKEDVFMLMLNNIVVDEFQKKNIIIREKVPQTSNFENITAKFGANNFSNHIIINLGKELKKVELKTIELIYGENALVITAENFNNFFRVNKFAEFNRDNFSITTIKLEANNQSPAIILKPAAINFLKKEKHTKKP